MSHYVSPARRPLPAVVAGRSAARIVSNSVSSGGLIALAAITAALAVTPLGAACPEGRSVPITSGGRGTTPVVFSGLGPKVEAGFFILGRADAEWNAGLAATAWVVPVGDVDGDGIEDYRIEAPGLGPGGWGDPLAEGCPATTDPPLTPLAITLQHPREDLDGDGKFDVFEDRNRNDNLDPGEDRDGDGRLTPSGRSGTAVGCEGVLREDVDCDGNLDRINEDFNHNGRLDPGEDLDGDNRFDLINEDRNGNGRIDFFDRNRNGIRDFDEPTEDTNLNGFLDGGYICIEGNCASYIEDRNNDQQLNDRPAPTPADMLFDVALDGTIRPLPPHYPYGGFHPSAGGVVIGSVAWDGDAYDFSAITTPTLTGDGGEDPDGDGAFDVFEDRNRNGLLDAGEDLDGDGRLTPAGGCEGRRREDVDCDGVLDRFNEDFNANGLLDPGEDLDGDGRLDRIEEDLDRDGNLDPGEDTNLNGRLDHGDQVEDRNRNQILDDRPFPDSGDVIMEHRPDGTAARISSTYPYGTFTPTGAVRVVRASPGLAQGASGAHLDPQGAWRVHLETNGVDLVDDVGGTRDVIVAVVHVLGGLVIVPEEADVFPSPPPRFVETGASSMIVPTEGNGASGVFVSIVPDISSDPPSPLKGRPRTVWSEMRVATTRDMTRLPTSLSMREIVDLEMDRVPIPEDNCPDVVNPTQADADADGVGDVCDPEEPPGAVAPIPPRWEVITPDGGPGARSGAAAAFDEGRGVMVLFGGAALDASTWEFDGAAWRRVATVAAPAARTGHRMVYDGVRRRVLLFGGVRAADGTLSDELWHYDGADWSRVPAGLSPSPRRNAGLAFDAARDRLVLFGGEESGGALADTWEFAASSWRRVPTPQSPAARAGHQMVYDPFRRLVVMQGGSRSPSEDDLNDTWGYDGDSWLPIDHTGEIPATAGGTMVFDPDRRQAVVTGGQAGAWGSPPPRPRTILTAAARLFAGVTWSTLPTLDTPAPRRNHGAAFDSVRGLLVVQGGSGPSGTLSDTTVLRRAADSDGDGVPDRTDNCPMAANPDQDDADADASGDRCDNCPQTSNATQRDRDSDGLGDACDDDLDGDGVANDADVCPGAYVAGRLLAAVLQGGGPDSDADGTADDCDRCPLDAGDDADADGVCGDADNCPLAFNPRQEDGTADGHGDACQTTVRLFPVRPLGGNGLTTRVLLGSPDGDPLAGVVMIRGTVSVPDVLADLGQGCALAYLPNGVQGEGIVYAAHPDTPVLGDADSNLGCADGLADFELALGTCEEAAARGGFDTLLTIKTTVPHAICIRAIGGAAEARDYTVWRISATDVLLAPPGVPLIEDLYQDTRLPNSVSLGRLPGPGLYVLRVTAADGTTPEASDEVLFARDRENSLHLVQRRDRRTSGP